MIYIPGQMDIVSWLFNLPWFCKTLFYSYVPCLVNKPICQEVSVLMVLSFLIHQLFWVQCYSQNRSCTGAWWSSTFWPCQCSRPNLPKNRLLHAPYIQPWPQNCLPSLVYKLCVSVAPLLICVTWAITRQNYKTNNNTCANALLKLKFIQFVY